jgi:HNH endonuclease
MRLAGLSEEEAFRWFMPDDPPTEGCWDWPASTTKHGYGKFGVRISHGRYRTVAAHVAAYRIFHGPIPDKMKVLHSCDRPICCQPIHLRAGTQVENMADAVMRNRHAHGECAYAKLTETDVLWIRTKPMSQSALGLQLGVSRELISRIQRGLVWKHLLP